MSEIKRYEMTVLNSFAPDRFREFGMVESEQGEWVRWEDVKHLIQPTAEDSSVHVPDHVPHDVPYIIEYRGYRFNSPYAKQGGLPWHLYTGARQRINTDPSFIKEIDGVEYITTNTVVLFDEIPFLECNPTKELTWKVTMPETARSYV